MVIAELAVKARAKSAAERLRMARLRAARHRKTGP
jgi:hypothetical protein